MDTIINKNGIITESTFEIDNVLNGDFINVEISFDSMHSVNDTLLFNNNIFKDCLFLKPIDTEEIIYLLIKIKNHISFYIIYKRKLYISYII